MLKKNNLVCAYCHLRGDKKESCYKLVRYPPGRKFYKNKKENSINIANSKENVATQISATTSPGIDSFSHAPFTVCNPAPVSLKSNIRKNFKITQQRHKRRING